MQNVMDQLSKFFTVAAQDSRIVSTHILLYVALLECSNQNQSQSPFFISRRKIMRLSKIHSIVTYHKYMKELYEFGYIIYEPSYHPMKGTKVWIH
jgi:hypothetical protein